MLLKNVPREWRGIGVLKFVHKNRYETRCWRSEWRPGAGVDYTGVVFDYGKHVDG